MSTINLATLLVLLKMNSKDFESGVDGSKKKTLDLKDAIAGGLTAALAVATKAAIDFGKESVAEFQTFEKGIKEVYTLLPGASEEALGAMRDDIIEFSKESGRLTDETVPALYQAISAGVPQENVFDFMKIASDAALGGVTDLETAVDGISSATNAYGIEALSAQQASDLMFTAVKGGKTTFEELSASLFNVIPTAAALKVEFSNVTAALASMTAQGVPTSVATTQLRQLLVELSKDGSKAAATFEDLAGVGFREFIAQGGNLQEALQIMEAGAADLDIGINDLFGSVEAGSAALALTGEGTAKFTQELNNAAEAAGATAEAAATMADSMQHLEDRAAATSEAYKIQTGGVLAPLKQAYLEGKIALLEYAMAADTVEQAYRDGNITYAERTEIIRGLNGSTYDAAGALDALDAALNVSNRSTVMAAAEARDADAAMLSYARSVAELEQIQRDRADAERDAAHQTEYLASQSEQLNEQMNRTADIAANAEERLAYVAEQEELAAEAARLAAEAQRELNAESGNLFQTLSASEGPLGLYYQSLEDIANGATDLTINQDSLNGAMITAAANAGASASQLALLKVATGELSAEQAEAVIKQVALEQTLARLGEQYASGALSMDDYISAAQSAVRDIQNMTVEFDTQTGAVNTSNQAIGELVGTMGQIPSEVRTHISITSDPMPNMPTVGGSSPGGGSGGSVGDAGVQTHARGGFTGWGAETEVAGVVHGQEFVFSAPAVRNIGLPVLEMLHSQAAQGGGNNNYRGIVNNNFYGSMNADTVYTVTRDAQQDAFRRKGMR